MNRWASAVRFVVAIAAALALAGLLTACDKSPTGPTGPPGSYSRFEIVGPRTVAPGETAQFSAVLSCPCPAPVPVLVSRDVTNEASWSSSNSGVLSIAAPGLATGRERGDAWISAVFNAGNGLSNSKEVIVVPAGTYRLMGLVSGKGPVVGARLDVTSGPGAGLVSNTGADGRYRLYGVSGATNIRVTKDGYEPQAQTITIADHQTFDIELLLPGLRSDVSGTYTLTIAAAGDCQVGLGEGHLPEDVRVRRYTAAVSQRGPQLEVVLSGATFGTQFDQGDGFPGRVEPGRVVFDLTWEDDYAPKLIEQLPKSTSLVVHGTVLATGPADRLAGTLDGYFQVFDRDFRFGTTIAWCRSASHQFVLSR